MALERPEVRADLGGAPGRGPAHVLVSVIVRSIGRPTLDEALASIAAQTYPSVEAVVVDALGEGHPAVPSRCGAFPVRVVSRGVPLPRSRAANVGLAVAEGQLLAFLDDDDWLEPDHVGALVSLIEEHPPARAGYAGVRGVAESGEVVHTLNMPFSHRRLRAGNYIPINAMVFARTLVEDGCSFDEDLDLYEDWDFWLQVARRSEVVHLDRFTANYRAGGASQVGLSARSDVQHWARRRIYEKWMAVWSPEEIDELLEALDDEIGERERIIRELSLRTTEVEAQLADTLGSLSWKITGPLRSLALVLRGSSRAVPGGDRQDRIGPASPAGGQ